MENTDGFYRTAEWRHVSERARARDQHRCTVSRLFGGTCSDILHAHHIVPLAEGGSPLDLDNVLTACAVHHPMLEALRRHVLEARPSLPPCRCRGGHRYDVGRRECRARRERAVRQAA